MQLICAVLLGPGDLDMSNVMTLVTYDIPIEMANDACPTARGFEALEPRVLKYKKIMRASRL